MTVRSGVKRKRKNQELFFHGFSLTLYHWSVALPRLGRYEWIIQSWEGVGTEGGDQLGNAGSQRNPLRARRKALAQPQVARCGISSLWGGAHVELKATAGFEGQKEPVGNGYQNQYNPPSESAPLAPTPPAKSSYFNAQAPCMQLVFIFCRVTQNLVSSSIRVRLLVTSSLRKWQRHVRFG